MGTKVDEELLLEVASAETHMHDSEIPNDMRVKTINKTGNLKKKRRSRKDTRLRETSDRAVDKQVVEANSEQLAERLLNTNKMKAKATTETLILQ